MRTNIIDPIADTFIAHLETNRFAEIGNDMPKFKDIQDCIDLCESYYQIIYSFYLNTSYGLHGLKRQIDLALYPLLNALRVYEEYHNNRDEIIRIAIDEQCLSKRHEKIAKKLAEIIDPKLYRAMSASEGLAE